MCDILLLVSKAFNFLTLNVGNLNNLMRKDPLSKESLQLLDHEYFSVRINLMIEVPIFLLKSASKCVHV